MMRKAFHSFFAGGSSELSTREMDQVNEALAQTKSCTGTHLKANQILGRKEAIGCVSLEISQRCNLDCSLCYLSSSSNQVTDLPIQEVFRRLDEIKKHFGIGTDVQISGGDPTMRDRKELMQIVRYAREIGLHPALFTNGIRCTRDMVEELAENGLSDIAFHVDLTQGRKGFNTEEELNAIRKQYIDLVRGLPLMVIFNTTVHENNFAQVPDMVRFFIEQADVESLDKLFRDLDIGMTGAQAKGIVANGYDGGMQGLIQDALEETQAQEIATAGQKKFAQQMAISEPQPGTTGLFDGRSASCTACPA